VYAVECFARDRWNVVFVSTDEKSARGEYERLGQFFPQWTYRLIRTLEENRGRSSQSPEAA
jgi:hypothetical protein